MVSHLKNYNLVYQITNNYKGEAIGVFFHRSICFKLHWNLTIKSEGIEALWAGIINKTSKHIVLNALFRPPHGGFKIKHF